VSSHQDEGLTLTEAAIYAGMTRNALKKRCDRNTITYYLGDKGERRICREVLDNLTQRDISDFDLNPYDYDPKFDIPKAEIWGEGRAPVVTPSTREQWEVVMGINDLHVPYHDPVLIDAVLEIARDVNPHRFVINGDTNDFFALSRFNKAQERLDLLQSELDMGKQIRKSIRNTLPNAVIDETIGNHEERLITYPGFNAPALRSLNALKPSVLLGLDELNIKHWPTNGFRLREDFLIEHGVTVRSQSGATAKARLDDTLISGVMGHTHRMDSYRKTGYRDLSWYETGCLCMLNPDYVKGGANWKQGFWIGTFSTKTNNFNVQLIPSVGRGFIFDNKHYGNTGAEQDIWSGPTPNYESNLRVSHDVRALVTL
jgi:hypothetical protein